MRQPFFCIFFISKYILQRTTVFKIFIRVEFIRTSNNNRTQRNTNTQFIYLSHFSCILVVFYRILCYT